MDVEFSYSSKWFWRAHYGPRAPARVETHAKADSQSAYHDTGCYIHPTCLDCPRPTCIEDERDATTLPALRKPLPARPYRPTCPRGHDKEGLTYCRTCKRERNVVDFRNKQDMLTRLQALASATR